MSSDLGNFFKNFEKEQNKNLQKQKEVQKTYKKQHQNFDIPEEAPLDSEISKMGFKEKEKQNIEVEKSVKEVKSINEKSKPKTLKIGTNKKEKNNLKIKIGKTQALPKQVLPKQEIERNKNTKENILTDDEKFNKMALSKFKHSETEERFKDKWLEIFTKAVNSSKSGEMVNKFSTGRFMVKETGVELLSDWDTSGKNTNDFFNGGPLKKGL